MISLTLAWVTSIFDRGFSGYPSSFQDLIRISPVVFESDREWECTIRGLNEVDKKTVIQVSERPLGCTQSKRNEFVVNIKHSIFNTMSFSNGLESSSL